jgi:hypothetical protein
VWGFIKCLSVLILRLTIDYCITIFFIDDIDFSHSMYTNGRYDFLTDSFQELPMNLNGFYNLSKCFGNLCKSGLYQYTILREVMVLRFISVQNP